MKRFLLTILSIMFLAAAASADTITGLAIDIDPNHLESCAVYVRITAYHEKTDTVSIEIIVPEKFDANDIDKLSVGDSIFTNGEEIMIESITEGYHAGGLIILNEDTDPVWLTEDDQQLYRTIQSNDDYVWLSVATLEIPLPDNVLFLDGINPEDGGILDLPIVKNKDGLINVFSEDEEYFYSSLALNNVYAVFNEAGELSVIERYYVPWY
ncbi:MAG: hypothetical protein IKG23_09850 [Clostridia bacterium]|nr:hypothetical protein [Clostridia bacterium]